MKGRGRNKSACHNAHPGSNEILVWGSCVSGTRRPAGHPSVSPPPLCGTGVTLGMSLLSRLLRAFARPAHAPRKHRPMRLETLEGRDCPAVSVLLDNATHTLTITGDNYANNVNLLLDDLHNQLKLTADGASQTFKSGDVWKINLDLKGGNDNLQVALADGS